MVYGPRSYPITGLPRANSRITDPLEQSSRLRLGAVIEAYGGRYLVRGGAVEQLEGRPDPNRLVILEFPDMVCLKAFYQSAPYQPLLAIRRRAARSSLIAVEGV